MLLIALGSVVWHLWRSGAGDDIVVQILHTVALATPLALGLVMAAPASEVLGAARRLGIEIRDLAILDRLRRVGAVVIGHRGVLVPDRLRVISAQCVDGVAGTDLIRRAAAVAQAGHDPWGMAVLDFAVGYRMRLKPATSYHSSLGQGCSAWVERQEILIGTRRFVEGRGASCAPLDQAANLATSQGRRLRWVAEMTPVPRVIGFISFGAPSVSGAVETVRNLNNLGFCTAWIARPDDAGHVALGKHLKIGKLLSEQPEEIAKSLEELRRQHGPLLLVTADELPAGLTESDTVLPFGRRIMEQVPMSALATTRHDPRIIVDLLQLAGRHRQLVLTNLLIAFAAAAIFAFLPQYLGSRSDLGSYEVAIVLLLAMSSLGLRAMPMTANEVDEE
ncbi:MAG: cation-translocating P-type ATPase [Rhodospirillaceae bacterium]|nr:cation-translocating P-type ATPase [Rhodospirillaceae bacterium]